MRISWMVVIAAVVGACGLAGCHSGATDAAKQSPEPQAPLTAIPPDLPAGSPPDAILIPSKYGNVTFTHKTHFERAGGDCSVCHTKMFPQSLAPLNYKKALHRVAEADRTSCASCHAVGGSAFAADSNCIRCHAQKDYTPK
jgi:c(7)-type cytochrome triheme protein